MRRNLRRLVAAAILAAAVTGVPRPASAQQKPEQQGVEWKESPQQRDARMKWWREARFGMFIHWGFYSVPAGTYNGTQVPGIGEWIMHEGRIPVKEYETYAQQFNPTKFDAEQWVL